MSEPAAKAGEAAGTAPPPRVRRGFKIALISIFVVLAVLGAGATAALKHTHTNEFCIGCHEEPGHLWMKSPHKDVECRTCHPADMFEEARLGWAAYVLRKKEVGEHRPMDAKICASCHIGNKGKWPEISATPGHAKHVAQKALNCLECHVKSVHIFQADVTQCLRCHGSRAGGQQFVGAETGAPEAPVATYGSAGKPADITLVAEGRMGEKASDASHDKAPIGKLEQAHCLDCHDFLGRREKTLRPTAVTCRACHAVLDKDGARALLAAIAAGKAPPMSAPVEVKDGAAVNRGEARTGAPIWTPAGHDDCLGCHRPHGRPVSYPQDCLTCHAKLLEPGSRHMADERLNACALCHAPHDPSPRHPLAEPSAGGAGERSPRPGQEPKAGGK